jgi:hypothetical protein
MIMRSPLGTALATLVLLLAATASILAEARLSASLGFGGCAPPERWVPLMIRAEGVSHGTTVRVDRLAHDGRSLGREYFPALDGVPVECPVWTGAELDGILVAIRSGDRTLAETRIPARSKPFPGHIVLACGLSARARLAIATALLPVEPVLVVDVDGSELPANGLCYDSVSAIAIGSEAVELSPAQRSAMLAWLAGGGRLCATAGPHGALAAIGLVSETGRRAYGLGIYTGLSPELAEAPESWREALALEPYDPDSRLGAGSLARATARGMARATAPEQRQATPQPQAQAQPQANARSPGREVHDSSLTRGARATIAAASAAWVVALLLAALLGRGRAAPFAAVSAICLAAVLAGAPSLDRAIRRGASFSARALMLPESGAAFVELDARAYSPPSELEWALVRAAGSPRFRWGDSESGVLGEWRHDMARAAFGLRAGGAESLQLEGMLEGAAWETKLALSPDLRSVVAEAKLGDGAPPDVDSAYPLAFLGRGDPAPCWTKEPGKRWAKSEFPPSWLAEDEAWLFSLRGGKGDRPLLVGRCPGKAIELSVGGGPLREISWAMPLPGGGIR